MLKGKTQGIDVLEPVSAATAELPAFGRYLKAYDMLKAGAPHALEEFAALGQDCPEDALVAFHLGRLRQGEAGTMVTLSHK